MGQKAIGRLGPLVLLAALLALGNGRAAGAGFGINSSQNGGGVEVVVAAPTGPCGPLDIPKFLKTGNGHGQHYCCLLSGLWGQCEEARDYTALTNVVWGDGTAVSMTHTYDVIGTDDPGFVAGDQMPFRNLASFAAADLDGVGTQRNFARVLDNDVDLTNNPTCANSGYPGALTVLDVDESVTDVWQACRDLSTLFQFPAIAGAAVVSAQVLFGSGPGTGVYRDVTGDMTIAPSGAVSVSGTVNDCAIQEYDGAPVTANSRSLRVPSGALTVGPSAGMALLQPATTIPPWASGLRYSMEGYCTGPPNNAIGLGGGIPNNVVNYYPFYVPNQSTANEIGFRVQTAGTAGDLGYAGIYSRSDATGLPVTALYRTAGIGLETIGVKTDTAINMVLDAGWYFFAFKGTFTGGPAIYAYTTADCLSLSAPNTNVGGAHPFQSFTETFASAGLPATATTSTASMGQNLNLVHVWVRKE